MRACRNPSRPASTRSNGSGRCCLALPEVTERLSHGAPTWFVRGKTTFVDYWPTATTTTTSRTCGVPAPPGEQGELIAVDPDRFFRPPYVGRRGWIGVRLDVRPDWGEIADLCVEAYRHVAPAKLVRQLRRASSDSNPALEGASQPEALIGQKYLCRHEAQIGTDHPGRCPAHRRLRDRRTRRRPAACHRTTRRHGAGRQRRPSPEQSGRGLPLRVRSADGGTVAYVPAQRRAIRPAPALRHRGRDLPARRTGSRRRRRPRPGNPCSSGSGPGSGPPPPRRARAPTSCRRVWRPPRASGSSRSAGARAGPTASWSGEDRPRRTSQSPATSSPTARGTRSPAGVRRQR